MAEDKKKKSSENWIYGIIAVFMVGELAMEAFYYMENMDQNFKTLRLR